MFISAINGFSGANSQNFGHNFRVRIGYAKPNGSYEFINPVRNRDTYKEILSRVVEAFNSDHIANLREVLKNPAKSKVSNTEEANVLTRMMRDLFRLDSDYQMYGKTRSVHARRQYNKNEQQLPYIATGIDDLVLEQLIGAKNIGINKLVAKNSPNNFERYIANSATKKYEQDARNYVEAPSRLLRSSDGKEIMLNIVCEPRDVKGKYKLCIKDFDFYEVKKSEPLNPLQKRDSSVIFKSPYWEMLNNSIQNQVRQITGAYPKVNVTELLARHKKSPRFKEPVIEAVKEIKPEIKSEIKPVEQPKETKNKSGIQLCLLF